MYAAGTAATHAFAVSIAGSASLLKADVAARHGDRLRPSFMRPQLITWKLTRPVGPDFRIKSLFARLSGLSLGLVKSEADVAALVAKAQAGPWHLHVFPAMVPENGFSEEEWKQLDARAARLRTLLTGSGVSLSGRTTPEPGDDVLDVILDVDDAGSLFVGMHRHAADSVSFAGAIPRAVLPAAAPSRAWLKLEQALAFASLSSGDALRGRVALELGSAPGGASLALVRRGVDVFGVDTGRMDPRLLEPSEAGAGRFVHLAMSAADMPLQLLPPKVDLLLSDLNLAPPVVLRMIGRLQERLHAKLLILTLKLNDRSMVQRIPQFMERLHAFAPQPVCAIQLPANRAEFCVIAGRL